MQTLEVHLPNSLDAIGLLGEKMEEWGNENTIPVKVIGCMTLMLDELVTNIIMHGYPQGSDGRIEVELGLDGQAVVATLRDWAPAFDPFSVAEADTTLAIEDRDIGGLGVHFVRRMADEYTYVRNGDTNEIHLKKKF